MDADLGGADTGPDPSFKEKPDPTVNKWPEKTWSGSILIST